MAAITIVIPVFNEAESIEDTVLKLDSAFQAAKHAFEIIVVDDGSTDDTGARARRTTARVIAHPTNKGYGNALLTGVRNATWVALA